MGVGIDQVRFAFQPLYSLHTGGAVAVEALAQPSSGGLSDLLRAAWRRGELVEADTGLAAAAVRDHASQHGIAHLPVHLNITARTVESPRTALRPLFDALTEAGAAPRDVVLEIGPPFQGVAPGALLTGMRNLADAGFRFAFDSLGASDLPLNLLADSQVDMVKLDRATPHRLPDHAATVALVESLVHFASRTGVRLVATGVETEEQLEVVRKLGIGLAQGRLFAPEGTLQPSAGAFSLPEAGRPLPTTTAPRVTDYLRPAAMLPATATCEEVRNVLVEADAPTGVVGVDEDGYPLWSIDRARFLLAVTGPFGHALHANRPAARLADKPHVVRNGATIVQLLDVVAGADRDRSDDDVVVVDENGRCQGVVLVTDVVRGLAEAKVEAAAALNPLTRLPGADSIAKDIDRRIAAGQAMVTGWLDIDSFKKINDTVGFAAGDDLIRALGRKLTDLSNGLGGVTISHVGGDDFLIVCDLDKITAVADQLLGSEWQADGMPVTLSLATLVCAGNSAASYREISRQLVPLKARAKAVTGSSWINSWPGSERVEVLRGRSGERTVPQQRPAS